MIKRLSFAILLTSLFIGCSSPQPPDGFLNSNMRIITGINPKSKGGVDTEVLRMRPVDLYNTFDRNIKSKKWKKIHENSWTLIIKGNKDPMTNMKSRIEFTLAHVPQVSEDIMIRELLINGKKQDSMSLVQMVKQLESTYTPAK